MPKTLHFACVVAAALGSATVGGVFFGFSTFVMRALAALPAPEGIAAMQSINVVVLNVGFLGVFVGTALLCGAVGFSAVMHWHDPSFPWVLAACVLYVAGTFGVTILCNVPRNDALAALAPGSPEAAAYWLRYVSEWTLWNHVRTAAALGASALFVLGVVTR